MLFWHVALLFSVLCTSVLASPGEPHESAPIQYVGASKSVKRLQGLWVRLPPKGDPKKPLVKTHIGIQGGKIVYSDVFHPADLQEHPEALVKTFWTQSPGTFPGGHQRTKIVLDRIYIEAWSSDTQSYSIAFSAANGQDYGVLHWETAGSLRLGGMFKKKKQPVE